MSQPSPYSERSGFFSAELGLLDTEPYASIPAMPHYKNGTEAKRFDLVKFQSGTRYEGKETFPIFSEGHVLKIVPGGSCCELTILTGSLDVLGTLNISKDNVSLGGIVLEGWFSQRSAVDCERVD